MQAGPYRRQPTDRTDSAASHRNTAGMVIVPLLKQYTDQLGDQTHSDGRLALSATL